jgi:hypothetical protein
MGFNSGLKGLINTGIINYITRLHLVGPFYEIYNTMHDNLFTTIRFFSLRLHFAIKNVPSLELLSRNMSPTYPLETVRFFEMN